MKFKFPLLALPLLGLIACNTPNKALIEGAPLISKEFEDGLGRTIKLRRQPIRVVSLAPNITETMFALGAGNLLVGRSHDSNYPGEALSIPEVVTFPDFDLAKVAELDPDLVLASTELHDIRIAPFFDHYNIPLAFQRCNSLDDIMDGINTIGMMLDKEAEAKRLTDSLSRMAAAIADSTKGQIKYKTAMVISIDPLTVAGGLSFQDDLLEMAGAKNAFSGHLEKYPEITPEDLIQAAPEYLLIPTKNDQAYALLIEKFPALHLNLPAAIQKQVYLVEPDIILRPGPRIVEGLAYLVRVLHARINVDAVFNQD